MNKMKKISIYVFIVIILTGFSVAPVLKTHGQGMFIDCYNEDGTPVSNPPAHCGELDQTKASYHLLQPLKSPQGNLEDIPVSDPSAFGKYLNIMISIFIGLCAVLSVVMIVIGGIEYSTSELISSKEAGLEKIKGAILGLLLALGAYLILAQINPDLLNLDVKVDPVTVNVQVKDFILSSAQTFDGKPGTKVDSATACAAAKSVAENIPQVPKMYLLAILNKESSGGSGSTGSYNYHNANMGDGQLACLRDVAKYLNLDIEKINMSGPSPNGGGHGGGIGLTQFIPCTLRDNMHEAGRLLGHPPNPWDVYEALVLTAVKGKVDGGNPFNARVAAQKYFGSCIQGKNHYCDDVENYMKSNTCA